MAENYGADPLFRYRDYWATDNNRYVLFPLDFPDGRRYYDIYDRDGEFHSLSDEQTHAALTARMLAAGVETVDPDGWLQWLTFMKYRRFWTSEPGAYLILLADECDASECDYIICDQRAHLHGWWKEGVYEPEWRQPVLDRMLAAGVEVVKWDELRAMLKAVREQEERAELEVPDSYDVDVPGIECLFRVLVEHSSIRPASWRLFRRNPRPHSYFARYLGCRNPVFGTLVALRATPEALPPVFFSADIELSTSDAEAIIEELRRARVSPYVNEPYSGGVQTTFRVGHSPHCAEFAWAEEAPEAWRELEVALGNFVDRLEAWRESGVGEVSAA